MNRRRFRKIPRRTPTRRPNVALKVINESVQNEPELRQRFLREANLSPFEEYPCRALFDFGEEADGLLYMVFEFIEGRTLKDILSPMEPWPNDAVRYSIEIRSLRST